MNIKTEIKEYGFPVTHNCVRSETRITELEAQLAAAQAQVAAVTEQRDAAIEAVMGEDYVFGQYEIEDTPTLYEIICDQIKDEIDNARAEAQAERRRLEIRVVDIKAELNEAQAEITRLRAGGCAHEQGTTQYCGEMQALVGRLTELAEDINRKAIDEDDERYLIAQRLREAISGEDEQQVGLLDIADDVIAEREAADQKWADMRYGGEGER